ncbi:MAG: FkbM family methyltransferase [Candidatus Dormibacteria bacterium]
MRIGLDFRFLAVGRYGMVRGIPRFTQEQLLSVLTLDSDNTYLLLCDSGADVDAIHAEIRMAPNAHVVCAPDDLDLRLREDSNMRTVLARFSVYQRWLDGLGLDLYHATSPAMPVCEVMPGFDVCPYVATAYDLIPLLYPAHYLPDPAERETYEQRLLFLEQATRIAAISHATAADVVEHLGVPQDRVDITPPAISQCFRPLPPGVALTIIRSLEHPTRLRSRRRVHVPDEYVLCVTDLHYSKNLTTLLPAYAGLPAATRERFPLVVAGHLSGGDLEGLEWLASQLQIGRDLVITGRVSNDELAALYNRATITVHPSHNEGFGLPVAEAMRCGAPVITTTRSALPETAGDAAVLVDSDDEVGLTRAIDLLLHDSERRDDLRLCGIAQAARFTPEELGRTTLRCYERTPLTPPREPRTVIRVAFWSAVPPQDAPNANHTDDLLTALSAEPDLHLDLFVDDDVVPPTRLLSAVTVHHSSDLDRTSQKRPFDVTVYEVGASRSQAYMEAAMLSHPGVVVLHDLRWSLAVREDRLARHDGAQRFRLELDALEGERAARELDRIRELPVRGRRDAELRFLDEHPMLGHIVDTAAACVTVTPDLARELLQRYPHAGRSTVIPQGVLDPQRDGLDIDRVAARAFLDLERDVFLVVVPGTDASMDDIEPALTALAALQGAGVEALLIILRATLNVADDAAVHKLVERLGVSGAVRVTVDVPRESLEAHLAACDVVVLPGAQVGTVLPDIVLRALATGRCVVMGDSPASRSVPDSACIRVAMTPRGDTTLVEALTSLAGDAARRAHIERAARAHYEDTAQLGPMVQSYLTLIREHAGRRPPRDTAPRTAATVTAGSGRPRPRSGPLSYSKVCELEDFAHPSLHPVIRDVCAHKRRAFGEGFPNGYEHRKDWEVSMAVRTLADHGALRPDARVLGVGAGTEDTIFYLTRHVGEVVAVDRYLEPGAWETTAPTTMLTRPAGLAPFAFDADRLTVQHMDARVLDFPDAAFDAIFSSGSIEHFGDLQTIAAAAYEMGRVLKPGGILTLSTELLLDRDAGGDGSSFPGTLLLSPAELQRYIVEASGLEAVDQFDGSVSHWTLGTSRPIVVAVTDRHARFTEQSQTRHLPDWACWDMPHIVMEYEGKRFTSVHVALRRAPVHPVADNSWARPTPALRASVAAATGPPTRAAALLQQIHALERRRDAAEQRMGVLIADAGVAAAGISVDLQEASLPQAGVYGPMPAFAAPMVTATAGKTVACPIDSTITPPYTVVVKEDADDIISAVFLAGSGAEVNTNLTELVLALVPEGGLFLDLGANIGSISLPVAAAGRRVISVEAEAENATLLGMSARLSGVADRLRVVPTAVGDHVGEAAFVPHGCHGQLVDGQVDGAIQVPITTVDALIESEHIERLDLVKIDVEGADFDVVRGLPVLAARADAPFLLVECCPFTLAAYGRTTADLVALLEAYGYVVYNVDTKRLMRRRADEVQVTTVMDVLAAKQGVHHLPGWRVEPPISERELVARLIAESRIWNADCRASAARVARDLHPDVLALEDVTATLDRLSSDDEPLVRAAAAWWRETRAVSGVQS